MITIEDYFGGCQDHGAISASITFGSGKIKRTHLMDPGASNYNVRMPPANLLPKGFWILISHSGSGVGLIGLKDNDGNFISGSGIAKEQTAFISCFDNSSTAGGWMVHIGSAEAVPEPDPLKWGYVNYEHDSADWQLWEYNHILDTWTQKDDPPNDPQSAAFNEVGARAYHTGGDANEFGNQEYDPNVWTARTSAPSSPPTYGWEGHSGSAIDGYNVIATRRESGGGGEVTDVIEYTVPPTDSWASKTDSEEQIWRGCSQQIASLTKAFFLSGYFSNGMFQSFDRSTWVELTTRLPQSEDMNSGEIDDEMIVSGGYIRPDQDVVDHDSYNPTTDAWTSHIDRPDEQRGTPSFTPDDGSFYMLIDTPGLETGRLVYAWAKDTDTWSSKTPIPGSLGENSLQYEGEMGTRITR